MSGHYRSIVYNQGDRCPSFQMYPVCTLNGRNELYYLEKIFYLLSISSILVALLANDIDFAVAVTRIGIALRLII